MQGAAPSALFVTLAMALAGCATVTRSPSANWTVSSYPEGAEVTSSNGNYCKATPCSFRVARKEPFTATVSKAGYEPSTVNVTPTLKPWGAVAFAGNAVVGGLIGIGVDAWTGSMLDPSHNGEIVTLTPLGAGEGIQLGDAGDGCSPDKAAYAKQVGVGCEALSSRFDFVARSAVQTAASKPAQTPSVQASADQPVVTGSAQVTQDATAQPADTQPTQTAAVQPVDTQPLPAPGQPAQTPAAQAAAAQPVASASPQPTQTPPVQGAAAQPVASASPQPTQASAAKPVQTASAQPAATASR